MEYNPDKTAEQNYDKCSHFFKRRIQTKQLCGEKGNLYKTAYSTLIKHYPKKWENVKSIKGYSQKIGMTMKITKTNIVK